MAIYPVALVPLKHSNAAEGKKRREAIRDQNAADAITQCINDKCKDGTPGRPVMITYSEIASRTRVHESTIRNICMQQLGGSDNSVEVHVPGEG